VALREIFMNTGRSTTDRRLQICRMIQKIQ
jgi:hypothetical protein